MFVTAKPEIYTERQVATIWFVDGVCKSTSRYRVLLNTKLLKDMAIRRVAM